jgi:hypothetical protein
MRKFTCILLVLASVKLFSATICPAQPQASTKCLSYEPAVVKLTGTIVQETFPGPPNYESVQSGDQAETYWILELARPVCLEASSPDETVNRAQTDIRRIQLVFTDSTGYKRYKNLVSKEVVAAGTLFGSNSGHHHTAVLLTVVGLTRAR